MKIIKQRERITQFYHCRFFENKDSPGSGWAFDCDPVGNVFMDRLNSTAKENYLKCISGEYKVVDKGVEQFHGSHIEPAVGLCNHCNNEISLSRFTNTCECGIDYNMSGQELAPREQWGEETGESPEDCTCGQNFGDL